MNVVLKQAVIGLGVPGEIVEVRPGYAFNFLIPNGKAMFASPENLEQFEKKKDEFLRLHETSKQTALRVKEAIEGKAAIIEKAVNASGVLYAAISPLEVAAALNEAYPELGFEFGKDHIVMPKKVREHGVFDFSLAIYNGVSAKCKLVIASTKEAGEAMLNNENK